MNEKYAPFELEPTLLYDRDTYKIVAGKSYANKDEKFVIGLKSNGFPTNSYLIFPPQLNLDLLRNLLGQDGAHNSEIIKFIKIITDKQ
ncbi:hypothetical protein CVU5213_07295 [Campylobacter vulpis]|uniref:Uncharacterized protein n=1 Tax=Campylobacter vulpis TaxID=1655500 RepID=A0A2G4R6E4_9BACT|nr:hypothetical protein [Campylobacter vulpis]MBS4236209.1 hypothetical protein [Campylobacter vulpis]MBS4241520.1 hypothetical protein [Campylobacter vulpis]MBS4252727.1 hypothetical protein [Campylobacter vulpis]MBS4269694.1 hypothetical protein [Campylobacter vulpis]MBS4282016.1 hypothetical protein [Campylobacter vulpis]